MSETLTDITLNATRAEKLNAAGTAWGERISANTASAALTFKTSAVSTGSVSSEITAGKHHFIVDEPEALAGDDVAASPVEFALGALISCQVVVYRLYAHQLGVRIDTLNINADADLDVRGLFGIAKSVRPGFGEVRLRVTIEGPETRERYLELQNAVDEHCPVLDIFSNPTPVSIELVTGQ